MAKNGERQLKNLKKTIENIKQEPLPQIIKSEPESEVVKQGYEWVKREARAAEKLRKDVIATGDYTNFTNAKYWTPSYYATNETLDLKTLDDEIHKKSNELSHVAKPAGNAPDKGAYRFFNRFASVMDLAFVDPVVMRLAADEVLKPNLLHMFGDTSAQASISPKQCTGIPYTLAVEEQNKIINAAMKDHEFAKKVITIFFTTKDAAVRCQHQRDLENLSRFNINGAPTYETVLLIAQRAAHTREYEEMNEVMGYATAIATFQFLVKKEMEMIP